DGPVLTCTVSGSDPDAGGPSTRVDISAVGADGATTPSAPHMQPELIPASREPSVARPLPSRVMRIGRAPDNDIVVADPAVSSHHAELRNVAGVYRIVDLDSTNGTFVNGQRVTDAALSEGDVVGVGSSTFRLAGQELQEFAGAGALVEGAPPPVAAPPGDGDGPLEMPHAVRWLVRNGERFANFDILNDNDTQLDYYRRFGHIYAVGVPAKKWRLVVVSDPELLDEVAGNEEQFGKRVEEINF